MIENKRYSFGSPEEAIQFFAQQSEDRFKALQDKIMVIESALKAIFAMTAVRQLPHSHSSLTLSRRQRASFNYE